MNIDEMFTALWLAYPTDLCLKKRGGRQNALKAFKKINPDQAEFYRMMENMKAQVRADRKNPDAYRWPFVSSYLNQARYDDAIESESERIQIETLNECCIKDCTNDVHGKSYKYCAEHVPNAHSDLLSKAWKKTGIKYGSKDFVNECKYLCRLRLNNIIEKMDALK